MKQKGKDNQAFPACFAVGAHKISWANPLSPIVPGTPLDILRDPGKMGREEIPGTLAPPFKELAFFSC